ncbi:hypothetical protein [Pseudolabrys sp. FHR47]|uniref:hypothetical protein n=1 Tax=Pseudolabrys sp. FHR47 TaxID=2562284 RepID=UPI0010BED635|nr:hypothetical protein [Pseudolabrys sp. FHR47]
MQLNCYPATLSSIRVFGAPFVCASCGDQLIAPTASAFVEGGEIRHYWECESCGATSSSSIALDERMPADSAQD